MWDPINIQLLESSKTKGLVRIVDEDTLFAMGDGWSFLGYKCLNPNHHAFLQSKQKVNKTLALEALSTEPSGFLSNGMFRPQGSMIAKELLQDNNNWKNSFTEALDHAHEVNRPNPNVSVTELANRGQSHAIYRGKKSDSRRFVEDSVPVADIIWFTHNNSRTNYITALPGNLIRFTQNAQIELMIPNSYVCEDEDVLFSKGVHAVLPRAVGSYGNSYTVFIVESVPIDSNNVAGFYHHKHSIVSWTSLSLAERTLLSSRKLFGREKSIANLSLGGFLCQGDLNVETKNLGLGTWWPEESTPELLAIDAMRWNGKSDEDIESFIMGSIEAAWEYQTNKIVEEIQELSTTDFGSPEDYNYFIHKTKKEISYLEGIASFSGNGFLYDAANFLREVSST